ncbi:unnamed protein product, partial [Musa acuminata subsp. burmannicoides]
TTRDADKVFDLWLNSMAEEAKHKNHHAVAGDRTRVTRVTGGNTHHYTTTTWLDNEASRQLMQARNATVFGLEDINC